MGGHSLRFTPFHVAAVFFLFAGLGLAVYHGLEQFGTVPRFGWISWSHIHFVTIGGFTQLLFGMLPQLAARKLHRPVPSKRYQWVTFVGLNVGFLVAWYGRAWDQVWAFDLGLVMIWILVAALLAMLLRMVMQSDRAWDATIGLYLAAVFVFLWGLTYAYGLYGHAWSVPGGWLGLREAHVHANAWGFLGLAAIGTLYDLFPRVLEVDLYSDRLKDYSGWLLILGIFPLITGPWLGMGRTITATGLVIFASGFALYLYNLVQTYRSAPAAPGLATSLLTAQFWMLGPAGFAPFVLFGVEWVRPAYIEDGALHFFFVGWALPIALAGLLLYFGNLPIDRPSSPERGDRTEQAVLLPLEAISRALRGWMVAVWNIAVFLVGAGFFYQDAAWSWSLLGPGYSALAVLWAYLLVRAVTSRWRPLCGEPTVG
jgi:cytochrome c oxidase cbb3-type subunit 1